MPYIESQSTRKRLDEGQFPMSEGELFYFILNLLYQYLEYKCTTKDGVVYKFDKINAISGVLANLKTIWDHEVFLPHEEEAKMRNGDLKSAPKMNFQQVWTRGD